MVKMVNLKKKWLLLLLLIVIEVAAALEDLRCPSRASPDQCRFDFVALDEYIFFVQGNEVTINYSASVFHLTCPENVTLENEFLPVFEREVVVQDIKLSKCKPPAVGFALALRSLNVSLQRALTLDSIPSQPPLNMRHFKTLNITVLVIKASKNTILRPEPDFLESLNMLIDLRLTNVLIDVNMTNRLPLRLKNLELKETGIERLSIDALSRLSSLEKLVLIESRLYDLNLQSANALRLVHLDAPIMGLTLAPSIQELSLWQVRNVELRGDCALLGVIKVKNVTEPLPRGWLSKCPLVEDVWVEILREGIAGAKEWRSAKGVINLYLRHGSLRELPTDWLVDNTELRRIDLSFNELETLPREIFRSNSQLQHLDLSNNRLRAEATSALESLGSLQSLVLANNPLGDLCQVKRGYDVNAMSSLYLLRHLRRLWLGRTGATRICRDWRTELPDLRELDLAANNITHLGFADMQWTTGTNCSVNLSGQTVSDLLYTRDDYEAAVAAADAPSAIELLADWALECDCGAYWVARALRERPAHAPPDVADAKCSDGELLRNRTDERLMCAVPESNCAAGCECSMNEKLTVLHCAGRQLQELPRTPASLLQRAPPSPPPALLVNASRTNLTRIGPLDVLHNLTTLDISHNHISMIDSATVGALSANPDLRVFLEGNPLECGCSALPLLRAVAARAWSLPDLQRTTCADGRPLAAAAARVPLDCAGSLWWLASAGAVLLLVSIGVAAALYRPAARHRFKAYLFEHGLCVNWLLRPLANSDDEDASRPYDAFVSFSHVDASYAAELSTRLERGARPWRLCLHERDWTPGEWIPAQIAASVRGSRRTLVLLSEHFLSSEWGCAELREAYAAALREHRPRLLLLLLPSLPPARAAAAAPPELRAYLASVTYLRWDDPQFWNKLRRALPPPRPSPTPIAA